MKLSLFINIGGDKDGIARPGRQSKFYKHWCMANDRHPKMAEPMKWDAFMGLYFIAGVEKVTKDANGGSKSDGEIYSRISHFVKRENPPVSFNPKSTNQKSANQQSRIKQFPVGACDDRSLASAPATTRAFDLESGINGQLIKRSIAVDCEIEMEPPF